MSRLCFGGPVSGFQAWLLRFNGAAVQEKAMCLEYMCTSVMGYS